jgi:outer membrane biosynthesis protein TonB
MNMRTRIVLISAVVALFGHPACGADQQADIPDKFKGIILRAPNPDDAPPPIARRLIHTQGVYRLVINYTTGTVDEIRVLKRNAIKSLDANVVIALSKWKFRPGTLKHRELPVVFDTTGVRVLLKNAGSG